MLLVYQESFTKEIIDNIFLLDIQEMLEDDEDDAFLIECVEQFKADISTTGSNNNEMFDKNISIDNTINIAGNQGPSNERSEYDDQNVDTDNNRGVSNEFLMEGGE